ncbi:endo-beta-N-acetylglucosaminidase [Streptomyces showdoensis]|uniref:endo-beta-N-acetylglucosaminidase n=1 Tax=Streptomyces showdoensis TaxID=68268 RepID=UPI0031EFAFF9
MSGRFGRRGSDPRANPTVVDAAHRNGVKCLRHRPSVPPPRVRRPASSGCATSRRSPAAATPSPTSWPRSRSDYGFDGWFVNQETAGGDAALATEVRNTMRYARSLGPVEFMWYDAMTESGSVSWQNA